MNRQTNRKKDKMNRQSGRSTSDKRTDERTDKQTREQKNGHKNKQMKEQTIREKNSRISSLILIGQTHSYQNVLIKQVVSLKLLCVLVLYELLIKHFLDNIDPCKTRDKADEVLNCAL